MFTWIPIHEETAKRLLEFKDRSHELVGIIRRMHEADLVAMPVGDRDAQGNEIPLKEIDPFTFLANFNRGLRKENRAALWQFLKDEWNLQSPVPTDYEGLPVANKQNARLIPFQYERDPGHVSDLWKFFEHIMTTAPESLDTGLMEKCLGYKCTGLAMLTMGMFWARPRQWIAADRKNLEFAATKGVNGKIKNAAEYVEWQTKARAVCGNEVGDFSAQAHHWATDSVETSESYGSPFNRMFPPGGADAVLDVFADALKCIAAEIPEQTQIEAYTFGSTSRSIPQLVLNVGMWPMIWYENRSGAHQFGFLLPVDHPEVVKQGVEGKKLASEAEGKSYTHAKLPASEFFERYEELRPAISEAIRAACRLFAGWKGTPYLRFHRPELVELASDSIARIRILKDGLPVRVTPAPPPGQRSYWLLAPGEGAKRWDEWLEHNIAAIGWKDVGDLEQYETKDEIGDALETVYGGEDHSSVALMLWNFRKSIREGDIIFAKLGRSEVIGWGVVCGSYSFDPKGGQLPSLLPVEWRESKAVKMPEDRTLPIKTLTEITKDGDLLEILSKNFSGVPGLNSVIVPPPPPRLEDPYTMDDALAELFMSRDSLEHILEQLRRKKNIILQGAPGVGKTFIAKRLAWLLLGAKDESAVEMVQFHQSYTYEDFVQGLRPTKDGHFAVKDGCFYRLCRKALANPQQEYFLVIDEINRGNLSKILGELMMLIETDKRGEALTLAYSEEPFTVPPNLYLIGTMNTADRSLSLVDYALRRRFAFLALDPGFNEKSFATHLQKHGLGPAQIQFIRSQMEALNAEIEKDETNLGKGYRIGHSFFTPTSAVPDFRKWWQSVVRYEIMPLLDEYWIDDPKMVERFRTELTENIP